MAINFPSSPTNGQVFADTSTGLAWVYSSTSTAWSASFNRSNYVSQTFTATAGQTSFTVSGGYLPTLVTVYQNGVLLVNGTDVTVTSGTAVVLAVGAVVGDIIQVVGSTTFNVAAIDASAVTTGTLVVARGGTGASTLAANNVLLGNGTSALQAVAPGTNGNVLTSNGTTWTSSAPSGGVTSLAAGTAISVSASTGAVTVTNTGVTSLAAGGGITVSASTGAVTVSQDFYTGTTTTNTSYPIGSYVFGYVPSCCGAPTANATVIVKNDAGFFKTDSGTTLTGTWRSRGRNASNLFIAQRVA
jgi:hypothetical protein